MRSVIYITLRVLVGYSLISDVSVILYREETVINSCKNRKVILDMTYRLKNITELNRVNRPGNYVF